MQQYNGWRLLDTIQIVEHTTRKAGDIPLAYMVDPSNRTMLRTAIEWARSKSTDEPKVHTFENKGFRVQLDRAPQHSWQGGKLSFAMCVISKDGKDFSIGIDTAILMEAIKQSTVKNGVFEEDMMMARAYGKVGLVNKGMTEYKLAIADENTRKAKAKKTSKHEIGKTYESLTYNNIYLGKLYKWVGEYKTDYQRSRHRDGYKKLAKPELNYIFPTIYENKGNPTISEFMGTMHNTKEIWDTISSSVLDPEKMASSGIRQSESLWMYNVVFPWSSIKKLPARTIGELSIEHNSTEDDIAKTLEAMRERITLAAYNNVDELGRIGFRHVLEVFYTSAYPDKAPKPLTEEEKVILKYMIRTNGRFYPIHDNIIEEAEITQNDLDKISSGYYGQINEDSKELLKRELAEIHKV